MAGPEIAAIFAALQVEKQRLSTLPMTDLFAADPSRFKRYQAGLSDLLFDYSKHRIDAPVFDLLLRLARASRIEEKRAALFAGERVNPTEGRPALHMALRDLSGRGYAVDGRDIGPDIAAERAKVFAFARRIRDGEIRAATGEPFTDIVNIGIGGSDLGPAMATRALSPFARPGLKMHFVANVDGADIGDLIVGLDPARTLFIVSSKSFTTIETMTNAQTARAFVADALGEKAVGDHFAAVSTKLDLVAKFGIAPTRVFGFWDWVGGRYSIWSSIGLALTIAIGPENFTEFLRGGEDVDSHFLTAPLAANIPVLMALLGVYYRNVWGFACQAVIPYDQRLARFPAYLQQLEMESNGKSVTLDGAPADLSTGAVLFGEPGTNGQHAFFQLLHQGTEIVPVDFLLAAEPIDADQKHHELLMANCIAQSEALMRGRSLAEVERQLKAEGLTEKAIAALAPHKVFGGNRPSSTLLYRRLDPRTLGRLIALYEHKVFVQAAVWNINPFDQWGVELGKELASRLVPIVAGEAEPGAELDSSTRGLIEWQRHLTEG